MFSSHFARNYAMYALASQYNGVNLVVPNIYLQPTIQRQWSMRATDSNMCSVSSTDSEINVTTNDNRVGQNTESSHKHNQSSCSKQEIKFSIDRILSQTSDECASEHADSTKDDNELKTDGKEFEFSEDTMQYSWLQCTRYKPPKLQRLRKKDGVKKRKLGRNPRVPFTQYQVAALEQKFCQTHYLSSIDVAELSSALNLTETRVKIWFQNRRARERRDRDSDLRTCNRLGSDHTQQAVYSTPTSTPTSSWGLNIPTPHTSFSRLQKALQRGSSAFTPVTYTNSNCT